MPQRKRKTPKLPRLTHMAASRQGVEVAEAGTHRETAGTAISGIDLQQGTPEGSPVKRKTPCIHPASSRSSE